MLHVATLENAEESDPRTTWHIIMRLETFLIPSAYTRW